MTKRTFIQMDCKRGTSNKNSSFIFTFIVMSVMIATLFVSCDKKSANAKTSDSSTSDSKSGETTLSTKDLKAGLYANIKTAKGDILVDLSFQSTPMTVENFIGLASGKITGKPFFDGLNFHRVEPGFVIQGGDPNGNGSGGPDYQFPNEIDPSLSHLKGVISMANAGPHTNGSQFFITLSDVKQLDGGYSVFGKVANEQSMKIVEKIAPGDVIKTVEVVPVGDDATKFFNDLTKESFFNLVQQKKDVVLLAQKEAQKQEIETAQKLLSEKGEVQQSPDGIMYVITQQGEGEKPKPNQEVECHYTLTLLDGQKLDSSLDRNETFKFVVGAGQVIKGWDITLQDMKKGEKRTIVLPPELGYGARGIPGAIPKNAFLKFDIELINFK